MSILYPPAHVCSHYTGFAQPHSLSLQALGPCSHPQKTYTGCWMQWSQLVLLCTQIQKKELHWNGNLLQFSRFWVAIFSRAADAVAVQVGAVKCRTVSNFGAISVIAVAAAGAIQICIASSRCSHGHHGHSQQKGDLQMNHFFSIDASGTTDGKVHKFASIYTSGDRASMLL